MKISKRFAIAIGIAAFLSLASMAPAHEKETHKKEKAPPSPSISEEVLKIINESYLDSVKPIFKKSCFDCHSSSTNYPWYANLPGAKQLIKSDIAEAKEHLDMSDDFPFKGHGTPTEDLEAIKKAVEDNSMPPFRYWILHPGSQLNADEKKTIFKWVENSLRQVTVP